MNASDRVADMVLAPGGFFKRALLCAKGIVLNPLLRLQRVMVEGEEIDLRHV